MVGYVSERVVLGVEVVEAVADYPSELFRPSGMCTEAVVYEGEVGDTFAFCSFYRHHKVGGVEGVNEVRGYTADLSCRVDYAVVGGLEYNLRLVTSAAPYWEIIFHYDAPACIKVYTTPFNAVIALLDVKAGRCSPCNRHSYSSEQSG